MNQRVDVHTHLYPEPYLKALREREFLPRVYRDGSVERFIIFPEEDADPKIGRPITQAWSTAEGKLAYMDDHAIDRAIVSLGNPWLEPFDGTGSLDLVREVNVAIGRLEGASGGRLLGLGALPSTSVEDALDEIRWMDEHESLRGIVTGPRIVRRELGDGALEPVWSELERREIPVLIHPQDGVATDLLGGYGHVLPVGLGFPMETTVAVSRLVFAGVLHRFPDLKLVVSHGGGVLSSLVGRLDAAWRSDPLAHRRLPEPPSRSIARLYVDAITYSAGPLRATTEMVGSDHIMFGTDHPFSIEDADENLKVIEHEFSAAGQRSVFSGTASELFGLV